MHIATSAPRPDVPLDLRGTAFQIQVWRFLLGVPAGSVVSYSEVAKGIGAPNLWASILNTQTLTAVAWRRVCRSLARHRDVLPRCRKTAGSP
jgi:alkylated DNA nucleotide flippase Atl1